MDSGRSEVNELLVNLIMIKYNAKIKYQKIEYGKNEFVLYCVFNS